MSNISNVLGKEIESFECTGTEKGQGIIVHNGNGWLSRMHGKVKFSSVQFSHSVVSDSL